MEVTLGLDIGGTNLKAGVVDREGNMLLYSNTPVEHDSQGSVSIDSIAGSARKLLEQLPSTCRVVGVGISTPGLLDTEGGIVHYAINLGWSDCPLGPLLSEKLQLPFVLESDIAAAAVGEQRMGSAKNRNRFLFISIGTGIGACFYSDGAFLTSPLGPVMNIGHMSVDYQGIPCGCGNVGCLEKYVSSAAMVARAERERRFEPTLINEMLESGHRMGVQAINQAALKGDPLSVRILSEAGVDLGGAIVNLVQLMGPGDIIVGGGVSLSREFFMESARRTVKNRLNSYYLKYLNIVNAEHPGKAGVYGAAALAFRFSENE